MTAWLAFCGAAAGRGAALVLALLLAACASVDADADRRAQATLESQVLGAAGLPQALPPPDEAWLTRGLGMDEAVRWALHRSAALQALREQALAEQWAAADSARPPNPWLSLERALRGDEREITRALSFGLAEWLAYPARSRAAAQTQEAARVRLAGQVLDQALAVQGAWVRAVAAEQALSYARQVQDAAHASAELARRMEAAGNFNRLSRARQHAFYADASARLVLAEQALSRERERLVRLLDLSAAQAASLRLPARLPDLPAQPLSPQQAASQAAVPSLELRLARMDYEALAQSRQAERLGTWTDVEAHVARDSVWHGGAREPSGRSLELSLRVPVFNFGDAARARDDARVRAAGLHLEALSRARASTLRERYVAYRAAWDLARHHQQEILPLRRVIADENLLRYNGMLIGVFELLADAREQVGAVMAGMEAQAQFWLAEAEWRAAVMGRAAGAGLVLGVPGSSGPEAAEKGH